MVVYCLKFVLRGESPRDYADLLRSLKFPPSISICDIPDRLAKHVNNTLPGFFSPYDGMLFPSTEGNLLDAEQGLLEKSLPWLHDDGVSTTANCISNKSETDGVHPITGVTDRYCLFDRFHERNSSQRSSLLRRVTLVPELNGLINTEAEEQLHSSIGRSNYCLNTMKPSNHLFVMRLKIHSHNDKINSTFKRRIWNTFTAQAGHQVETTLDVHGRLVLKRGKANVLQESCNSQLSCQAASPKVSANETPNSSPAVHVGSSEYDLPLSPVIPVSGSRVNVSSAESVKQRRLSTSAAPKTSAFPSYSQPGTDSPSASKQLVPNSDAKNVKVRELL